MSTEKDLQVPKGVEQPKSLGGGAEGDPSSGGHGPHLPAAGRVHPPSPTAHHLYPARRGTPPHTNTHSLFILGEHLHVFCELCGISKDCVPQKPPFYSGECSLCSSMCHISD